MKTAKEWLGMHGDGEPRYCIYLDKPDIEAIQADAREQGRREGLEEAARGVSALASHWPAEVKEFDNDESHGRRTAIALAVARINGLIAGTIKSGGGE